MMATLTMRFSFAILSSIVVDKEDIQHSGLLLYMPIMIPSVAMLDPWPLHVVNATSRTHGKRMQE